MQRQPGKRSMQEMPARLLALLLALAASSAPAAPAQPQFIFLGDSAGNMTLGGRPLRFGEVYGRLFTLVRRTGNTNLLTMEGRAGEVSAPVDLSGLAPVVEDDEVRALRARYVGKHVWMYGGLKLDCRPEQNLQLTFGGEVGDNAAVQNVWRVVWPGELDLRGTRGSSDGGKFKAQRPLVVRLRPDQVLPSQSGGALGEAAGAHLNFYRTSRSCPAFSELYGGAWHLERLFSLSPPSRDLLAKAGAWQQEDRASNLGLTKWQVAWRLGFPDGLPGTVAELLRRDDWQWSSPPGYEPSVHFRQGRAVRDEPSNMP